MNRRQTRAFLSHLCAVLPHTAPYRIDPELVSNWHHSALIDVPGDLAFEIADALAATWTGCHFPRPADFNTLRREHRPFQLGAIDNARSGLIAARAALHATDRVPTPA